jgi:hypothetical protein
MVPLITTITISVFIFVSLILRFFSFLEEIENKMKTFIKKEGNFEGDDFIFLMEISK